MLKWDIKIHKYPKFMDEIEVITTPNAYKKFYANRLFEVRNSNNEIIAEGNSIWIYLNTETKRPITIPDFFGEKYQQGKNGKACHQNPFGHHFKVVF